MKKLIPFMISGSLLASILLAGCGTNTNTKVQTDTSAAQPAPSAGANENGNPNRAMNIGKIKSISGSTITIYTADMTMAPGQNGGGKDTGAPQGEQGAAPQGNAGGEQGTAPEGGTQQGGGGQGGGMKGGGMQGGRMQQNFSEETTDITIGADTTISSVTFDNGAQKESTLKLSDLKADDIIRYTLKTDSTEAASITLSNGNPGGGMARGNESAPSTN
ncbi:hypothetical protein H1230_27875 [Paenibacillus sp. 19GGS1-52]|uniref:hypothetical protein n=1 Tax=Paenibacillus sp. 19GGS1-52 TaxID=2758563 RepID=UPI001EFABC04|nr:hypothetical protein [Paenibacillus sp. 19GGS1-52]ULO06759.1 hypothetical protein H1230_27875 [Paenibacillus sp. 19GGS1-52]